MSRVFIWCLYPTIKLHFPKWLPLVVFVECVFHKYRAAFITDSHRKFTPCPVAYLIPTVFSQPCLPIKILICIFGGSVSAPFVDLQSLWVKHGNVLLLKKKKNSLVFSVPATAAHCLLMCLSFSMLYRP